MRVWLCLTVAGALLAPAVRAQEILTPDRITSREQFYSSSAGTVAFLPQVQVSEDARFAGQWDLLVESGRYEIDRRSRYCFVINHRDPGQEGRPKYVAIGALSVLRLGTQPVRPISMFRNQGWSRTGDAVYPRDNDLPKHVPLSLETFVGAHNQGELDVNDELLTHRWHGHHGEGESWADRDFWARAASDDARVLNSLAGDSGSPDLRFDGKLLRFAFTAKRASNRPVSFCISGDRRIATILRVFSPHFSQAERRFELVFRQ